MAKSRLAPLKAMTMPGMELYAARLATRLDPMIRRELDMPVDSFTFWTDSICDLRYIENKDKRFQIFVENCTSPQQPNDDVSKHRLTLLTKHSEGLQLMRCLRMTVGHKDLPF